MPSRLAVAAIAAALSLTLTAAPAVARRGPVRLLKHHHPAASSILRPGKLRAAATSTVPSRYYLGGFDAAPAEGTGSISETFKLPTMTCAATNDYEGILVGEELNPFGNGQYAVYSGDASSGVMVYCDAEGTTTPGYYLDVTSPAGDEGYSFTVSPGDTIQSRIVETANGHTVATTTDLTNGQQVSSSGTSKTDDTDFYAGVGTNLNFEDSDEYIPRFTKISFTNSQINGEYFNAVSPAPSPFALQQNGPVQVVPSKLAAKPSPTWSVTEKSPY